MAEKPTKGTGGSGQSNNKGGGQNVKKPIRPTNQIYVESENKNKPKT